MTHVFIVNKRTMKIHLEYLFAGTGSSNDAPFLIDAQYANPRKKTEGKITSSAERNLVAMIADVSRIRIGDKIIFYLQSSNNNPGMFFGVFEAASEAFYQPNSNHYLTEELGKSLNFRVLIRPHKVYAKGISEHEALDSLVCVQHPSDMCWSLIYRKLKGNRGCTMITDNEARRLEILLSAKNNDEYLESNFFSFENNGIVASDVERIYVGQGNELDILPRLLYKDRRNNKCESHLQAYIVQNIDKEPLKSILLEDKGRTGKVLKVFVDKRRAIVEGLNMVSKSQKPSAKNPQGGIVKQEAPIHISNLNVVDPKTGKPTRIGRKLNADGKLVRYAKKSGEEIK